MGLCRMLLGPSLDMHHLSRSLFLSIRNYFIEFETCLMTPSLFIEWSLLMLTLNSLDMNVRVVRLEIDSS
jgi:hypothetical protein